MTLGKLLRDELKQRFDADMQYGNVITVENERGQATIRLTDFDRYSATMRALTVACGPDTGEDARAFLSAKAASIARALSYLEEPLAVWELDGGAQLAQLRSSPPLREGDDISYWEIELQAGAQPSATLARYRWSPGMPERESLVYPATYATLARITDSLVEALTEA
ncbi:hypothetical protein F8S13_13875 [Chloroflexia bacterium SDU3-3]|nr:hypothetical protein F8S13_13875 [Chloroflexia bacterium SDU3-3]